MSAIELIKAERERQVSAEGWTPEHDDAHDNDALANAGAHYAASESERYLSAVRNVHGHRVPIRWPWENDSWKPAPENRIRELVKAGALIVAEIERLQRKGGAE